MLSLFFDIFAFPFYILDLGIVTNKELIEL